MNWSKSDKHNTGYWRSSKVRPSLLLVYTHLVLRQCKRTTLYRLFLLKREAMTYEDFKKIVLMDLEKSLNSGVQIEVKKVKKNNGVILDALTIQTNECSITPCIYLNGYYNQFKIGRSIRSIIGEIIISYENSKGAEDQQFSKASNLIDFNSIKDNIYFRVVNAELNRELLKNVPHKKYLDLALVYSCLCSESKDGIGSITIQNAIFNSWDCTFEELHDIAVANTMSLFPAQIRSMEEIFVGMFGNEMPTLEQKNGSVNPTMYVLSNTRGIHGASTMFYPQVLKKFVTNCMEKIEQIVILPSSIHESILVPLSYDRSASELNQMVRDINETQVAREEVLSNHIYYYSVSDDEIRMVQEDALHE